MKDACQHVIPVDFYDQKKWHESIVNHYAREDLPKEALSFPIEALTASFANIINVYGNFPEDVQIFLSQATNPMFSPEEYEEKIYRVIKEHAVSKRDPYVDAVAESLYYIRLLFEQDKEYIYQHFKQEIYILNSLEEQERIEKFAKTLSSITKIHANQVAKLVGEFCTVDS
jgi:hypothetical protein